MWMFTDMALRMAQEIGLHREGTARGISSSQSQTNVQETGEGPSPSIPWGAANASAVGLEVCGNPAQVVVSIVWTSICATELAGYLISRYTRSASGCRGSRYGDSASGAWGNDEVTQT